MKNESDMEDDLRAEYDLKKLQVRRLGSGRKSFGGATVRLDPDIAEVFPDADAVNQALRFLIRVTRDYQASSSDLQVERSDAANG